MKRLWKRLQNRKLKWAIIFLLPLLQGQGCSPEGFKAEDTASGSSWSNLSAGNSTSSTRPPPYMTTTTTKGPKPPVTTTTSPKAPEPDPVGPISDGILPDARKLELTPGVIVGVPGGIPQRTTICATIDADVYGKGTVDASPVINEAVKNCAAGGVVYIPPGKYRLDKMIGPIMNSEITLRGAGMGQTTLVASAPPPNTATWIVQIGKYDNVWPTPNVTITGGATKGSRTVTVADASTVKVGGLVQVEHDNAPYVMKPGGANQPMMIAMMLVESKSGNSVTFTQPLPFDFTSNPRLAVYQNSTTKFTGIEDMTLDVNSKWYAGVRGELTYGAWVKNVEIIHSLMRQMNWIASANAEIRENYTHSVIGGGANHEGITLSMYDTYFLIENNISYNGGFPAIVLGDGPGGCFGNVVAYNYAYAVDTGVGWAGAEISVNHGGHNAMNLFEGNVAGGFASDGYWGSASHNTLFRNWFTATHPTATLNIISINLARWSTYFSLIGNVLGSSNFPMAGLFFPEVGFGYSDQVIYKVGFPNMGNNGFNGYFGATGSPDYRTQLSTGKNLQEYDHFVKRTLLLHGNYDYWNKATDWDTNLPLRVLPDSLYRKSKPSWWPAALAWPSIGPDKVPMNGSIPAMLRFKTLNPAGQLPPQ